MEQSKKNKRKIFNDPVLGFISISDDLLFDLLEHPYFQRLKRISQTGLSNYVYPGSTHTRFLHALGSTHLMQLALQVLKDKGVIISKEEERAVVTAILLHDIGHGPFSHALESTLMEGMHHEKVSITFMNLLNKEFNGELQLAIDIFLDQYPRKFFHQLISGQIDLDRLDYLRRDSFFTGVSEGNVNSERIITMMNVVNDELVIEAKGIYSIEKYLTSRLFMYWQVYFHKTSMTAEFYLIEALKRAKLLTKKGVDLPASGILKYFLNKSDYSNLTVEDINKFAQLDDSDILSALKIWQNHEDKILSILSKVIIQRNLPYSRITSQPISASELKKLQKKAADFYQVEDGSYFVHQNKLSIIAYEDEKDPIRLVLKNGTVIELQDMDNQVFIKDLKRKISRYHFCIPRGLESL
ncbi:HD domain-containing protein [Apibacter raozihei]|uniref:HD domain-containing protein n=1 Tax=Apibacter raozihei TaxID=2500547 RepID=UPI000FE440CF|nr:HD domain-containing protein [Apibacter raozihei]